MSSEDQSVDDQVANKVLQESYCHIIEQLNVSEVSARLYTKHRITISELDQLQNVSGNLTDQQRRHRLYSTALAGKGKQALDAFLGVLDDTAIQYEPHALLASKLRAKLIEENEHHFKNRTLANSKSTSVPSSLPDVFTHRGISTSPSLPERGSTGASDSSTPKSAQIPAPSYAFITSPLNTSIPSSVPTSLNDVSVNTEDSSQEQEVSDGYQQPLVKKNLNKSIDEGLGGSMLAIHNPSATDDGGHQYSAEEQLPQLNPTGRHSSDPSRLEYTHFDKTATISASKVIEDEDSRLQADGVPRSRPKLERSPHSLSEMVHLKLILLGNNGVGKTSLMHRFLHGTYNDTLSATIGGMRTNCYLTHTEKKINIELAIWDTAGQERFNCVSPSFYRRVDVAIMVFDMTDNESRISLHAVEEWNSQLIHCSNKRDIPIILAGSKCDSFAVNKSMKRHAEHLAKKLNFDSFMEVSAKENYQVEALFQRAVDLALVVRIPQNDPNVIQVTHRTTRSRRKFCSCTNKALN